MEISAQKMIEKFGLVFVINWFETPVTIKQVLKDDYLKDCFKTYDDAVEAYRAEINKKFDSSKKNIVEYQKSFSQYSWLQKMFFKNARGESFNKMMARLESEANEMLKKAEQKPELIKFAEGEVYNCEGFDGDFVNIGDEFYDVVTNWNGLDVGIYKGVVESVEYFLCFANEVSMRGTLEIKEPNKDGEVEAHYFDLRYGKDGIESGHTYHNIFKSKADALKFFEDEISSKINKLQKRLEVFKEMN